jgi:hypothetical protein
MFTTPNLAMMQRGLRHDVITKGEMEVNLAHITLEIFLTASLAAEVSDFMRTTLYNRTEGETNAQLKSASFDPDVQTQRVTVRMAPDQTEDSYSYAEAKVGRFHVTRSKSGTWRCRFVITVSPASDHHLMQIVDSLKKSRFYSFADTKPDLFSGPVD